MAGMKLTNRSGKLMRRSRPDQQHLTIDAVARRAGVSAMTVSNVTNCKGRVSQATRERVLLAIQELGYVPNQSARRLVGSAVACVGLIHADIESVFIEAVLSAVAVVAAENGVQLQIMSASSEGADAMKIAGGLVRSGAQAILLLPPFAEFLAQQGAALDLGVPVAAIATANALPDMTTIRIDNRSATYAITERLIEAGRKRIAFIAGPRQHSDSAARREGYQAALLAHGLAVSTLLEAEGDFTFQSGLVAAQRLLETSTPPDAIVASNDDMAAAALWIAHQRGIQLPSDLLVTGFDDTLLATRVWPPLTTVRQPVRDMAAAAMAWLAQAVRSGDRRDTEDILLSFTIAVRQSG
jgi:LacI family transcriptional regulator